MIHQPSVTISPPTQFFYQLRDATLAVSRKRLGAMDHLAAQLSLCSYGDVERPVRDPALDM